MSAFEGELFEIIESMDQSLPCDRLRNEHSIEVKSENIYFETNIKWEWPEMETPVLFEDEIVYFPMVQNDVKNENITLQSSAVENLIDECLAMSDVSFENDLDLLNIESAKPEPKPLKIKNESRYEVVTCISKIEVITITTEDTLSSFHCFECETAKKSKYKFATEFILKRHYASRCHQNSISMLKKSGSDHEFAISKAISFDCQACNYTTSRKCSAENHVKKRHVDKTVEECFDDFHVVRKWD